MKNVQQAHLAASTEQRDPAHGEDRSTVAEERVGVLGVPNELLDIILGYAPDLETRFAAAQTSHQFCESGARALRRLVTGDAARTAVPGHARKVSGAPRVRRAHGH